MSLQICPSELHEINVQSKMARQICASRKRKLPLSLVGTKMCSGCKKCAFNTMIFFFNLQRPWIEFSSGSEDEEENYSHLFKKVPRTQGQDLPRPSPQPSPVSQQSVENQPERPSHLQLSPIAALREDAQNVVDTGKLQTKLPDRFFLFF